MKTSTAASVLCRRAARFFAAALAIAALLAPTIAWAYSSVRVASTGYWNLTLSAASLADSTASGIESGDTPGTVGVGWANLTTEGFSGKAKSYSICNNTGAAIEWTVGIYGAANFVNQIQLDTVKIPDDSCVIVNIQLDTLESVQSVKVATPDMF